MATDTDPTSTTGDQSNALAGKATAAGTTNSCGLALVTGAKGGIGSAIVTLMAQEGWDLALYDLESVAPSTLNDLRAAGTGRVECFVGDIGDPQQVVGLFHSINEGFQSSPDLLVNNAAIQTWSSLLDLSPSDWDKDIRTNLTGAFLMIQQYAKSCLSHSKGGNIINIGSGCNQLAFPSLVSYTASKGGLEMLTKSAALELGQYGIRVNCIAPGAIETDRTDGETEDYAKSWSKLTPLARVGTPEDVAKAVLLMADGRSAFISGQTLGIDGGLFSRAAWPEGY